MDPDPGHTITVTAASVKIDISLKLENADQGTTVSAALSTSFSTAEGASALLNITVVSVPEIAVKQEVVEVAGAPEDAMPIIVDGGSSSALSSNDSADGDDRSTTIIAIAATVSTMLVVIVGYFYCRRRKGMGSTRGKRTRSRTNPNAYTSSNEVLASPVQLNMGFVTPPSPGGRIPQNLNPVRVTSSTEFDPFASNPFSGVSI